MFNPYRDIKSQGSNMKRIISALFLFTAVGCASVATGIDTARNVVSTTVQTGMQAGADMVGAVAEDVSDVVTTTANVAAGVVETVSEEVKDQAQELEVKQPDFPTSELKED